ncbi:MAG: hypothetical protein V1725_07510 [archaeon]
MDYKKMECYVLGQLRQLTFPFHNAQRAIDRTHSIDELAKKESLNEEQIVLAKTAALFCDLGRPHSYTIPAMFSTAHAHMQLPAFHYTEEQITTVTQLIRALLQPSNPQNRLEEVLCDADTAHYGKDDFYRLNTKLNLELEEQGCTFSREEWLSTTYESLGLHGFYTVTARKRYQKKKEQYMQELFSLIDEKTHAL